MPLRFQRRITVLPGLSLNLNAKSVSSTVGLPGTSLYHTAYEKGDWGFF